MITTTANRKEIPKSGWIVSLTILVVILGSAFVFGQTLLDHAMCRSLPAVDRASEFLTTDKKAISWVEIGDVTDEHVLTWKWFKPSGSLYREDGPILVGSSGATYPIVPVAQEFTIFADQEVTSNPGEWRAEVHLDGHRLGAERFQIVAMTEIADYGDAPDDQPCGYTDNPATDVIGRFPTLFDTRNGRVPGASGAHALRVGEEALGDPLLTSRERDADDPNDPDQTPNLIDDDIDDGLSLELLPSGLLRLEVSVQVASTAPFGKRYLNALYDLNQDGEWRETPAGQEWIIRNLEVSVAPGETTSVEIPIFVDPNWIETLSHPRWLRLALTRETIPEARYAAVGGWDGSGQFRVGEIEDHKIGVAKAEDLAWAIRSTYRRAWAFARAQALAAAWSLSAAQAQVTALADVHSQALVSARAAEAAYVEVDQEAMAIAAEHRSAIVKKEAYEEALIRLPCAVVSARAGACVQAALQAIAKAAAYARASAAAAAQASAQALAWAQSVATSFADARSAAISYSAAVAQAFAHAEALAEGWASARAWAQALAQATSIGQAPTQTTALALAWVQIIAEAYAAVDVDVAVSARTLTQSYAEAIAAAYARAETAVLAAADAEAMATAWAEAVADARAIVRVSIEAMANAAAAVDAVVIEECCEGKYAKDCPSVVCPPCNSCCQDCPKVTCPDCPPCVKDEPADETAGPTIPPDVLDCARKLAWNRGQDHRTADAIGDRWERSGVTRDNPKELCCGGQPVCVSCMEYDVDKYLHCPQSKPTERLCARKLASYLAGASVSERQWLALTYFNYYWKGRDNRDRP